MKIMCFLFLVVLCNINNNWKSSWNVVYTIGLVFVFYFILTNVEHISAITDNMDKYNCVIDGSERNWWI